MMKLNQEKDKICLCLEGEMTVDNAAVFREHLLESLQQSDAVEIDFTAVTAVDLSCLQLMCSAHRFAFEGGKNIVIKDNSVPVLREARSRAGLNFLKSCIFNPTSECLWNGGSE